MKSLDRGSSLFWLLLAICIFIGSLRLEIGTARNPGVGFMAFGASGLVGILSLILFFQTYLKKEELRPKPFLAGTLWKRILFVLISLLYS